MDALDVIISNYLARNTKVNLEQNLWDGSVRDICNWVGQRDRPKNWFTTELQLLSEWDAGEKPVVTTSCRC